MNGLTIKDILMSEMKDKPVEQDVENYDIEIINIQIEQYYEREQDKYY